MFKGFVLNKKKGSLTGVTEDDIFIVDRTPLEYPKAGLSLDISYPTGITYNYITPSNDAVFSVSAKSMNGFARNFVQYTQAQIDALPNAAYPQVTGGNYKASRSDTLVADTLYEMVVESPDGVAVNYWFNIY